MHPEKLIPSSQKPTGYSFEILHSQKRITTRNSAKPAQGVWDVSQESSSRVNKPTGLLINVLRSVVVFSSEKVDEVHVVERTGFEAENLHTCKPLELLLVCCRMMKVVV
jgi:hypothetical protein